MTARPRALVVGQGFPWPATNGSFIRLAHVVEALTNLADVDLFCFQDESRQDAPVVPPGITLARVGTGTVVERPWTVGRRLGWLASSRPIRVAIPDFGGARRTFASWAADRYDVVWFSKAHPYEVLGRPRLGPTVVDLDDLEDHKIRARLAVPGPARPQLSTRIATAQSRLDARRWGRLQSQIARAVDAVTVCSSLDASRLGEGAVSVLPNCYELPDAPAGGRPASRRTPTVLFAGLLDYAPNIDAVEWLVDAVLPELRREVPQVAVRVVGQVSGPLAARLHAPPEVTVTGRVPAMYPELQQADLVAVPVRYGSGTRVKVLEAFAHRVPVVSTGVGVEGLEVEHDRHLLVADTVEDFATACARLLVDDELRERLTSEAAALHLERYEKTHAAEAVTGLAAALMRADEPVGR